MENALLILKQKIIKTDVVLKLLADKKKENNILSCTLQALKEKYAAKDEENKRLEGMLEEYKIRLQNNILQLAKIPELTVQYNNLLEKYNTDINNMQVKYQSIALELEQFKANNSCTDGVENKEINKSKHERHNKKILQLQNKIKHLEKKIKEEGSTLNNSDKAIFTYLEKIETLKTIINKCKDTENENDVKMKHLIKENLQLKNKVMELELENSMLLETNSNQVECRSLGIIEDQVLDSKCKLDINGSACTDNFQLDNTNICSNESTTSNSDVVVDTKEITDNNRLSYIQRKEIEEITKTQEIKIDNLIKKVEGLQKKEEELTLLIQSISNNNKKRTVSEDNASVCSEFVHEILKSNAKVECALKNLTSESESEDEKAVMRILTEMKSVPESLTPIPNIFKHVSKAFGQRFKQRKRHKLKRKRYTSRISPSHSECDSNVECTIVKKKPTFHVSFSSDYISDSESCLPNSSADSVIDEHEMNIYYKPIETQKIYDNVIRNEDSGCIISDSSDSIEVKYQRNSVLGIANMHSVYEQQLQSGKLNNVTKNILEYIKNNAQLTVIKMDNSSKLPVLTISNTVSVNKRSNSTEGPEVKKLKVDEDEKQSKINSNHQCTSYVDIITAKDDDNSNDVNKEITLDNRENNYILNNADYSKEALFGSDCDIEEELDEVVDKVTTKKCRNKTLERIRKALKKSNGSIYSCSTKLHTVQSVPRLSKPKHKEDGMKEQITNKIISNSLTKTESCKAETSTSNETIQQTQQQENNIDNTKNEVVKVSCNISKDTENKDISVICTVKEANLDRERCSIGHTAIIQTTHQIGTYEDQHLVNIKKLDKETRIQEKQFKRPVCFTRKLKEVLVDDNSSNTTQRVCMVTVDTPTSTQFQKNDVNFEKEEPFIGVPKSVENGEPISEQHLQESKKKTKRLKFNAAVNLINKLLNCPTDKDHVEFVFEKISHQEPEHIARIILKIIASNVNEKPDRKYTPPAPIMTETQRVLQGFMNKLEKSGVAIYDSFLKASEHYLLYQATLEQIDPISRLYTAICKQLKLLKRIRLFCCDAVYFMEAYVPFLYTVLSNWFEILPSEADSSHQPIVKVLVQLVLSKPLTAIDINLANLKVLLNVYHGYPKEKWNENEFFRELLDKFIEIPSELNEFALLLLCKRSDISSTHRQIVNQLVPLLHKENESNRNQLIKLTNRITSQFDGNKHSNVLSDIKEKLNNIK